MLRRALMAKKPKPKPKDQQMAEYFYRYGRRDALSNAPPTGEEEEIISDRAEHALKQWKESQKPSPNTIWPGDQPFDFTK